ncbi:MAG: hypothetical protein JXQ87_12035 [Bacteroidia bacterium]
MTRQYLLALILIIIASCTYQPNPDALFSNRDERDTDERLIELGWELVDYGRWYKTGYNTFAPGNSMAPRNWGKWELTKFGKPDSITVEFADSRNKKANIHYLLNFHNDYTLQWLVEYNPKKDEYYIDGFMSDQAGSKYTASHKPYLHMGFSEEESIITNKGVLGFEVGKTTYDQVYNDSLNDSAYNYLGIQFQFIDDTLQEIKIEHQNHLKTKHGFCFYSYPYSIPDSMGTPTAELVDLSNWYPAIPEIKCYRYGNLILIERASVVMMIIIRNSAREDDLFSGANS